MAKLGELLGLGDHPFYQGFSDNRNLFSGALGGMAANPMNPWGGFASGAAAGGRLDVDEAERVRKEQEAAQTKQSTIEWLQSKGYGDLLAGVEAGGLGISDAWKQGVERGAPQSATAPTADMQNYQFYANEELKAGRAPVSFMEFNNPATAQTAPSGYQRTQDGNLTYIPGGPADPSTTAPKAATDAQRRAGQLASVVDQDAALLLGDGSKPGAFEALADSGNQFWNVGAFGVNPMKGAASADYQRAQGAVENIAQSYLYAISGQAAPAGEVAKIVDSITPKPFENPAVLADKKRRLAEYVNAIQMAQQNPQTSANAGDGWEVIGVH